MKRARPIKRWLLFLLLFGLLGYFRENFFIHVNNILYMKYSGATSTLEVPWIMKPFQSLEYRTLYYAKYPFTLVWTALFYLCGIWAIRGLGGAPRLRKLLGLAYLVLLAGAALAMAWSFLAHGKAQTDEYTLSRWLLGIAQSPLPCLLLLASGKLLASAEPD